MPNVRCLAACVMSLMAGAVAAQPDERFDVAKAYNRLCATCHGSSGAGGSAPSMLDPAEIQYPTDADMFRIIAQGDAHSGMPGFAQSLSEPQIRTLVVYIRELQDRHARGQLAPPTPDEQGTVRTKHHAFRFDTLLGEDAGLEKIWSLATLPDGAVLIAEQPGRLRLVEADGTLHSEPVAGTPAVFHQGQGGLLEVALHPDYAKAEADAAGSGWVYLAFSDPLERDGQPVSMTKVIRAKLDRNAHALTDHQTIYQADPAHYLPTRHHFGTRLVFHDGDVYFPIGDRGKQDMAQDLAVPNGKIHRVHEDGRVPGDNPFVGRDDALPTIYTYGNRNPQGLSLHPATGQLWSTEHGPRGGDELNLIQPGANYGWPTVTFGVNYNGTPITHRTHAPGVTPPVTQWTPSLAVCGTAFVTGEMFPDWRHDLLITSLARQELRRLRLGQDEHGRPVVLEQEVLLANQGRIRDVHVADDGSVYLLFNRPDRIVRLTRAE